MAFNNTSHIKITDVPPGFLKQRIIKSHFSQFGTITRLTIEKDCAYASFENPGQAQDALLNGIEWKGMLMKIDFCPSHKPSAAQDDSKDDVIYIEDEPEPSSKKKRHKPSKSSHGSRSSDDPPIKIGRVDLTRDDEEHVPRTSSSRTCRKHRERHSSTIKFLDKIRSRSRSPEYELNSNSSFDKNFSSPSPDSIFKIDRDREDSREKSPAIKSIFEKGFNSREDSRRKSRAVKSIFDKVSDSRGNFREKSRPNKSIFEKGDSYLEKEDEGKSPMRSSEEDSVDSQLVVGTDKSDEKAIFSFFDIKSREKELPMVVDDPKPEFKFEQNSDQKTLRDSFPGVTDFFKVEGKSTVRTTEVRTKIRDSSPIVVDNIKAENKPVQRIIDGKKRGRESPPTTVVEKKVDEKPSIKISEESKVSLKSNDPPFYAKTAATLKDKLDLLEERDKQIRLMPETSGMESVLQGTCPDMCPEKERILRELRNMVAPYEALPDGRMDHGKAVKEYTRSSADQGKPLPHELRPEPVLTMTMSYLINCIISRIDEVGEENLHNWYDFCWGRLRAIRKDIIQQDLCDKFTVRILEQCARFHIACYDRLWGLSKSLFDDKLNTETLNNCLTSLMKFYKDLRRDKVICPHEAEFNAYFILLNMNNGGFLISEYQKYSSDLKQSPLIKQAVKMHLAYHNNMFATYFKLTKNSSYLNACLSQRFFQHVRTEALNTIIKSHCTPNKLSSITTEFLMGMLKLDSIDDCVNFCESTGLSYSEDEKSFKLYRNDFYISEDIYKIESPSSIIIKKRIPIAEAVTGDEHTLPIYLKHVVHESFTPEGSLRESALDASDQEEKMLRDNVERNLLMTRLKTTFVQEKQEQKQEEIVSSSDNLIVEGGKKVLQEHSPPSKLESSLKPVFPVASPINDNVNEDRTDSTFESHEEMVIAEPTGQKNSLFGSFSFKMPETFMTSNSSDETSVSQIGIEQVPIQESKPPEILDIERPIFTNMSRSSPEQSQIINFPPEPKPVSPKSQTSLISVPKKPVFSFVKNDSNNLKTFLPKETKTVQKSTLFVNDDLLKPEEKKSLKMSRPKPYVSRNLPTDAPKSQTKWEKSFSRIPKVDSKLLKKTPPNDKLRKKLSENMKKISARKYFRMWKEKASKLKSLKELEAMVLQDLPTKEYLALWGKPSIKRSLNLSRHIHSRKKSSVMVHLILHSDIMDKINRNSKNIGNAVINTLGEKAIKMADIWGNIAQPNPIFWKLVFALPLPPEGGTTFSMKLRSWCKAAFYRGKDNELSSVEIHHSDSGVPVSIKICVVEGIGELSSCDNLSALVVVRAHNWEATEETQNRLEKFVSLNNHPIPVAVLNVGPQVESIENVKGNKNVSWFIQSPWESSKTTSDVLNNLARNTQLFNMRIKPFCDLLDWSVEKLFDMIGQDSFFNDNLSKVICNPNNIILMYNSLILKVEEEIKVCQVNNYFGTAYEFKNDLQRMNNSLVFPDNYKDSNFVESLVLRCRKCKLPPLKLDFLHSKDFVSFLTNYCDDISCQNILKTLLRYLNLPDDDSDIKLSGHLKSVQWLPFIEIILKQVFMSHLLSFKVAYRDNVIKNIFNSHYWLES